MKIKFILVFIIIYAVYFVGFLLIQKSGTLYVDENFHYNQISRFYYGDYSINPVIQMPPGYHVVIASFARLFGRIDVSFVRLISLIFNVFSVLIFYLLAKKLDIKNSVLKTLQFAFLPILFPYTVLIYTDGFSLMTVLLILFLIISRKYFLSGLVSVASILVRQNNIVWVLMGNIIMYYQEYGTRLSPVTIRSHLIKSWLNLITIPIFVFILKSSHGSLVDGEYFAALRLKLSNLSNIYFFLFTLFLLFLPQCITNFTAIVRFIKGEKKLLILALLGFPIYLISFVNDHPFNLATWFVHNRFIVLFTLNIFNKLIFYLFLIYALLFLTVTKFNKIYFLIFPLTFIYLLPLWIIEWRYYIIPLALFILFRPITSKLVEYSTILILMGISIFLFFGMINGQFFP